MSAQRLLLGLCVTLALVRGQAPEPRYRVSGTVVDAITAKPLVRANLSLTPAQGAGEAYYGETDGEGHFVFRAVRPGKYSFNGSKLGYPPQGYGMRNLYSRYASALVVGPDQKTLGLTFRFLKGGTLTGKVQDVNGDPVPSATVLAYRVTPDGWKTTTLAFQAHTDDLGRYRVSGLPLGRYVVAVIGTPWYGRYMQVEAERPLAYPLTFAPSASSSATAGQVEVRNGATSNADIAVSAVHTTVLRTPAATDERQVYYSAQVVCDGGDGLEINCANQGTRRGGGTMKLIPGRYQVTFTGDSNRVIQRQTLDVAGETMTLNIDDDPPAAVIIEPQVEEDPAASPENYFFALITDKGKIRFLGRPEKEKRVEFLNVPAGDYRVALRTNGALHVKSLSVGGQSLTGDRIHVGERGEVHVTAVLDPSSVEIQGLLRRSGAAQSGWLVTLVPKAHLDDVERYRQDQTDSDGTFRWMNVEPGEYWAFAFEEGEESDYLVPARIQEELTKGKAVALTVHAGENPRFELSVEGRL